MKDVTTAYHEAGHVAAYFDMGRPIRRVTIVPTKEYGGCCDPFVRKLPPIDYCKITSSIRAKIEREVMVDLAGCIAEDKYLGRDGAGNWEIGGWSDMDHLINLIDHLTSGPEETDAYINLIYIRTKAIINQEHVWAFIQALASALLENKTISGKEAKAIWDAVLSP